MTLATLVGHKLVSKDGEVKTEELGLKEGDVVGLYFSAHWCPPCRGFTPKLAEFHKIIEDKGSKKFVIIFVSSDRTEMDFKEYFRNMPWHALPFDEDDIKEKLSTDCGVQGIPMLVLFDHDGKKLKTKADARSMVMSDPEGKDFPWTA